MSGFFNALSASLVLMCLMSVGYFMPVADLLAHSEMHAQIQYRVEEKVGLYDHRSSTR